jgi:hypothetical protein
MSAKELMTYASRYGGSSSFSFMNLFNLFSTPKEKTRKRKRKRRKENKRKENKTRKQTRNNK